MLWLFVYIWNDNIKYWIELNVHKYIVIQKYMVSELEKEYFPGMIYQLFDYDDWLMNILAYVCILNLFFVYFRYLFKV